MGLSVLFARASCRTRQRQFSPQDNIPHKLSDAQPDSLSQRRDSAKSPCQHRKRAAGFFMEMSDLGRPSGSKLSLELPGQGRHYGGNLLIHLLAAKRALRPTVN